jgi:putative tryptophan/tyrosine transport system substrate-binding protein
MLTSTPIASTALGLDVRIFEVRAAAEFEATFERLVREKIDGICVGTSPLFVSNRTDIVVLAARARLPSVYSFREFATAGGLVSYGANLSKAFSLQMSPTLLARADEVIE